jgi:hypothetical protein
MQHSTAHVTPPPPFRYDTLRNSDKALSHVLRYRHLRYTTVLLKAKKWIKCNKLDKKLILKYLYLISFQSEDFIIATPILTSFYFQLERTIPNNVLKSLRPAKCMSFFFYIYVCPLHITTEWFTPIEGMDCFE